MPELVPRAVCHPSICATAARHPPQPWGCQNKSERLRQECCYLYPQGLRRRSSSSKGEHNGEWQELDYQGVFLECAGGVCESSTPAPGGGFSFPPSPPKTLMAALAADTPTLLHASCVQPALDPCLTTHLCSLQQMGKLAAITLKKPRPHPSSRPSAHTPGILQNKVMGGD